MPHPDSGPITPLPNAAFIPKNVFDIEIEIKTEEYSIASGIKLIK